MIRAGAGSEGAIKNSASEYGFSRKGFYQINETFETEGLNALVPKKPGPKKPHKLNREVAEFIESYLADAPNAGAKEIATAIKAKMGISIHSRTIYRYFKKN